MTINKLASIMYVVGKIVIGELKKKRAKDSENFDLNTVFFCVKIIEAKF